jgi:glycosyltransferase involved in cell wall biosynthesis
VAAEMEEPLTGGSESGSGSHHREKRSMRVMIVGPYPVAGNPIGGVESAVAALVEGLEARDDVDAVLVADTRGWSRKPVVETLHRAAVHWLTGQSRLRLLTRSALDVRQLRRVAARFVPDIVHGQGIGTWGDIAVQLGHPTAITVHGLPHHEDAVSGSTSILGRVRGGLLRRTICRVVQRADAVVSISEYDRSELAGCIHGRSVVIPNAIRSLFLEPCSLLSEGRVVLYAGLLIPRKNVVGIVRAFGRVSRRVPDARLVIAGPEVDPSYADDVREAVRAAAPAHIDMVGSLDSIGIRDALVASSVVVLFSWQETLPCIIAEAMAVGRPVVAARIGGVSEMVEHNRTGVLVSPGDEEALAEALVSILESDSLGRRMRDAARVSAEERYSPSIVADMTVSLYQKVLYDRSQGGRGEPHDR